MGGVFGGFQGKLVFGQEPRRFHPRRDMQLAQRRTQIFVHGIGAAPQDAGDLLGLHVLVDQPEHLALLRRQGLQGFDLFGLDHGVRSAEATGTSSRPITAGIAP